MELAKLIMMGYQDIAKAVVLPVHILLYFISATGMLSPENMVLQVFLKFSLIFLSKASATASAALPLGNLIMGTTPVQ